MQDLKFLEGIINAVSDPIFVKNEDRSFVLLNDATCELIGLSREELIGKNDFDLFPKEEAEVFKAKDDLVFATNEDNINQETITNVDGEQRIISTKKRIYEMESGEKLLVGVIRDITDAVRHETELQNKNKELESFASLAAHDLKSPLDHLHSLNLILKGMVGEDEKMTRLLDIIDTSTTQMSRLVENLLSYARSGKYVEPPSDIPLNAILEKVIDNLQEYIKDKKARVVIDDELPLVKAHEVAMIQLFQNLISNGIKYNQSTTPTVEIKNKSSRNGQMIMVIDNGIGIDKKDNQKIFHPLLRLHDAHEYEGSGLGLATCQKIMDFYKGKISVTSKKKKGSSFILNFPKSNS